MITCVTFCAYETPKVGFGGQESVLIVFGTSYRIWPFIQRLLPATLKKLLLSSVLVLIFRRCCGVRETNLGAFHSQPLCVFWMIKWFSGTWTALRSQGLKIQTLDKKLECSLSIVGHSHFWRELAEAKGSRLPKISPRKITDRFCPDIRWTSFLSSLISCLSFELTATWCGQCLFTFWFFRNHFPIMRNGHFADHRQIQMHSATG